MRYMKTINEMQALVTKFRREVQRNEAPKLGFHVKTVGECICISGVADPDCPVHGLPKVTPDLPLKVKVAKALGKEIEWVTSIPDHHWKIYKDRCWQLIPDYDKHIDLAMEVLEEYKDRANTCPIKIQLNSYSSGKLWFVTIPCDCNDEKNIVKASGSLPQAICEAIVAHAEGR